VGHNEQIYGELLVSFLQYFLKLTDQSFFCHPMDVTIIYHEFGIISYFLLKVAP